MHRALALVVNAALGDGEKTAPTPGEAGVKDMAKGHKSVEDAVAAINKAMLI